MKEFLSKINGLSRFLNIIAGISLTFLMLLTVMDVILRALRSPICGDLRIGGLFRGHCYRICRASNLLGEGTYLCRFFHFKVFAKGKKYFQYYYAMSGDGLILPDRLESYQIWNGSPKIGRGLAYLTDAFLPGCLRGRNLLLCTVSGIDL